MDSELVLVTILVGLAGLFLARQTWATWLTPREKGSCGGGCSCSKAPEPPKAQSEQGRIPLEQISHPN